MRSKTLGFSRVQPVEDIQGQLTGRMVQCSFTVPNVNAMATGGRHVTAFIVELGTGVINGSKFTWC